MDVRAQGLRSLCLPESGAIVLGFPEAQASACCAALAVMFLGQVLGTIVVYLIDRPVKQSYSDWSKPT